MNKLITISSILLTAAAVKRKRPISYLYWRMIWVMETSLFNPESKIHTS